jgi:hypothetical protein
MPGRRTKFQSDNVMAGLYLGIAIAGVNTLIVLGAALAFMVIWKAASVVTIDYGQSKLLHRVYAAVTYDSDEGKPALE